MTDRFRRLIIKATRICKHAYPTPEDFAYWERIFAECEAADGEAGIEYAYKRCLGWQAGGADIPPYGPYGHNPSAPEPPPYPEESDTPTTPQEPPTVPDVPPVTPAPSVDLAPVLAALEGIASRLDTLIIVINAQRLEQINGLQQVAQAAKEGIKLKLGF